MTGLPLPVIDVSGLVSDDPCARRAVADRIGRACDETGFFYVTGHGISEATVQGAVEAAGRFFTQPLEKRMEICADAVNRGYTPLMETENEAGNLDVNEGFEMGYPVPPDDPDADGSNPVRAPSRWPDLPGFREPVRRHYFAVYNLGLGILRGFALHFDLPEDFFSRSFKRPVADMRLTRYPPQGARGGRFGTFDHTDYGVITIIWQDDVGGLEVQLRSGEWVPAPPVPGCFVVIIGDLMAHWTNGRWRSTPHRVVNRPGIFRYSIPFYFNPDFDTLVDPAHVPGLPPDAEMLPPVISGPYLIGRFSGGRHARTNDMGRGRAVAI